MQGIVFPCPACRARCNCFDMFCPGCGAALRTVKPGGLPASSPTAPLGHPPPPLSPWQRLRRRVRRR